MRRVLLLILLFLLAAMPAGCSLLPGRQEEPANEISPFPEGDMQSEAPGPKLRETVFYLPDAPWRLLIPVRIYIPWEEGIAKATLRYCTAGNLPDAAAAAGLAPLLPAGTRVLGMSINDGLAKVDFSREFLGYPTEHEDLILDGITYTLTEFPTIDRVKILVEQSEPVFPGGANAAEPFRREFGLNLEVDDDVDDFSGTGRITLYFLSAAGDNIFYVPVTRVIATPGDLLQAVAQELLAGPKRGSGLFTAIPAGVSLQTVTLEGSKAVLHLAGVPSLEGRQEAAARLRQQVALTFTEIDGITEAAVLINGKVPDFGPGVHFPESFGRPKQWNLVD
ncbi:MAG: hypothetical protein GX167_01050 [Firmicutes bacterium]|nr:hypothetical protein [Bacillota bacterium]